MSGTVTAQLIELEGYTKSELRWKLAQMGGKPVPVRTLNHWIAALAALDICIKPNRFGLYEDDDLKLLARLMFWLKRRKTITQFADLITEDSNHASRNQAQARTNPRSRTAHRSSAIVTTGTAAIVRFE